MGQSIVANLYVLLPGACVLIAVLYPAAWSGILGALIASVAWLWAWEHFNTAAPFEFMAGLVALSVSWLWQCIVCLLVMLNIEARRKVGRPPMPERCQECGYLLIGLTEARCPECGRAFTASSAALAAAERGLDADRQQSGGD